jgi:hypothetical protein
VDRELLHHRSIALFGRAVFDQTLVAVVTDPLEQTGSWEHPKLRQCRGAAIFRANVEKLPVNPTIAVGPKGRRGRFRDQRRVPRAPRAMSVADEDLKWCGAESELETNPPLQPCCLKPDHDGPHRFWVQEESGGTDYGIRTYDPDGKAVQFLEVAGEFSPQEVAAIVQYLELSRRREP